MELIKELRVGIDNSYRYYRFTPEGAIVFLTYRCTSRCKTCNIWQRPASGKKELSWDEWKPIFEKLANNNLKSMELFGGDALLRKDLLIEMVRFCSKAGINTFLPTNSNLMDDGIARELVEAGLGTKYFSLDEVPSHKGAVRGIEDHFMKVDRAVQSLKKHRGSRKKPAIVGVTTLSRLNYRQLDNFIRYANSVPFDMYMLRGLSEFNDLSISRSAVNGVLPEPYFVSTGGSSNLFSREEAEELIEKLKEIGSRGMKNGDVCINMESMEVLNAENLVKGSYPDEKCLFCALEMILTPYGEVAPCLYFNNYIIGNLKGQEIKEIWGNSKHREFCKMQKTGRIDICNFCSIKFYHKSFISTASSLLKKHKQKFTG